MDFDLDASVVLLWGPNGTGKTTLFDAMLWLLQGNLPRLAAQTMRRNEDYIANTYRRGVPATVTARFQGLQHKYEITRHGNAYESNLEIKEDDQYVSGDPAVILEDILASGSLPLREVVSTTGLLQQDDLRLLLREKPDQRYRQLLRLLGLETLEEFERQLRARQKDARSSSRAALASLEAHRTRVVELSEEVETIQALVAQAAGGSVESLANAVASQEFGSISIATQTELSTSSRWAALKAEADELGGLLRRAIDGLEGLPSADRFQTDDPIPDGVLAQAETEAALARDARAAAERERAAVQAQEDTINQLALLAIPLLQVTEPSHGDQVSCPVCRTRVDAGSTIQGLTERARSGAIAAAAQSRLEEAVLAESASMDALNRLRARVQTRESQQAEMHRDEAYAAQLRDLLVSLGEAESIRILGVQVVNSDESADSVLQQLNALKPQLTQGLQRATQEVASLSAMAMTGMARTRAAEDSMNRSAQLPQVRARLETAQTVLAERQATYETSRRAESVATTLLNAVQGGTEQIFRARFAALEPLINDIYGRLDPHPTFTKLDFRVETYYNRGTATATVTDEDEEVEGNPLLIFSSAQANIVALSAFLALGWAARGTGLPFVLMDDPLQSLDDVNVLGFADLGRQLRRQRQIILSTHEERFARVLERKFAGRRPEESLLVHRFVGWGRSGPRVESRYFDAEPDSRLTVVAS